MKVSHVIVGVIVIVALFHLSIMTSSKTKISGFFKVSPKKGHIWSDDYSRKARSYFSNTKVTVWIPGMKHKTYDLYASNQWENGWLPLPGYKFLDEINLDNLSTVWTPLVKHPNYNAWASTVEKQWVPFIGYKFVMGIGGWTDVVWDPGQKNDLLKVIATQTKDQYMSYPGYTFTNPTKSLQVRWTPGNQHPDYPNYIAADNEGQWIQKVQETESLASQDYTANNQSTTGHGYSALGNWIISAAADEIFGDKEIAKKYAIKGWVELIKGVRNSLSSAD